MEDQADTVEVVLDGEAKNAVSSIAALLGSDASDADAVQHALGTEWFLLDQVVNRGAQVVVESSSGRLVLDLLRRE
jgi:hypothetical protein